MEKLLVFVYGTLRKHAKYHSLISGAIRVAEQCWTSGKLYDTGFGYPALQFNGEGRVYGELFEVTAEQLVTIDDLEDFKPGDDNSLYERKIQTVESDLDTYEAFVYVAKKQELCKTEIEYGDWRVYQLFANAPTDFLYFAYGSCMDQERFQIAKKDHLFQSMIGPATLQGYSLKYSHISHVDKMSRADIVEDGGTMEGFLYDISFQEGMDYLKTREGFPNHYRIAFVDVTISGKLYEDVVTFISVHKETETAPPYHYAKEILRGSKGIVSESYFTKLKEQLYQLGVVVELDEVK